MKFVDADVRWPTSKGVVLVTGFASGLGALHCAVTGGAGTDAVFAAVLGGAMAGECGLSLDHSPKASALMMVLLTMAWFVARKTVGA